MNAMEQRIRWNRARVAHNGWGHCINDNRLNFRIFSKHFITQLLDSECDSIFIFIIIIRHNVVNNSLSGLCARYCHFFSLTLFQSKANELRSIIKWFCQTEKGDNSMFICNENYCRLNWEQEKERQKKQSETIFLWFAQHLRHFVCSHTRHSYFSFLTEYRLTFIRIWFRACCVYVIPNAYILLALLHSWFWFIECVDTRCENSQSKISSKMWTSNMFCIQWISRTSPTKGYSKFKQYGNWIAIDRNHVQQNEALFSVINVFAALRCVRMIQTIAL